MFEAENYQFTYIYIVTLMTFIIGQHYSIYDSNRVTSGEQENLVLSLFLTIGMILFIGLRPISSAFTDMVGYAMAMKFHTYEAIPVTWDNNYIFSPMMAFLSSHNASPQTPIFLLAFVNIGSTFLAVRKLFPNDTILVLLSVFGSFVYFATAVNGIKAGCAMGLLLCAIAYRDKIVIGLIFLFLSMGFHHSIQMAVAAYIICLFQNNSKIFFGIWIACLLLSLFHITYFQMLFGALTDKSGASYLLTSMEDSSFGGRKGFRWDFVLYSSLPVVVGYYAIYKKEIISSTYSFILNMYLLTNSVWMLCMYAPYTNRIAEIPWGMLPIATLYPLLREYWGENQYLIAKRVSYGIVSFTFFMITIYYMFIHLDR